MINLVSAGMGVVLAVMAVLYGRGWLRLRRRGMAVASGSRLVAFGFAVGLAGVVFLSPLNTVNADYLFVRILQKVLLCLLAAPAFFLSCAFDVMLWGLPRPARQSIAAGVRRPGALLRRLRFLTEPWLLVFLFVGTFLLWHDPYFVNWALAQPLLHTSSLVLLGSTAMLFWWRIIGTGPRLHSAFSPWLAVIALLLVEIANMITGVSMAFATRPLYTHYAAVVSALGGVRPLDVVEDQALGGGMLWVVGSAVYVSSIILVMNRLFDRHGGDQPEPLAGWDADERMIAPGLEHRLRR